MSTAVATAPKARPKRSGQARETSLFRLGVGLIGLHVLDDNFV